MCRAANGPRVVFFVDGFNLYHSIKEAEKQLPEIQLKWLDIPALCNGFLHNIGRGSKIVQLHYFTAFAEYLRHTNPEKVVKHRAFVRALTARRVHAHIGKFVKKRVWSHELMSWVGAFEEKETDVSIACEVLSLAMADELDVAVIMTADSDFAPVAETFNQRFPEKRVLFAFPFNRGSKRLKRLCPSSFSISKEMYAKHQFPDEVRLPSGKYVSIPKYWKR